MSRRKRIHGHKRVKRSNPLRFSLNIQEPNPPQIDAKLLEAIGYSKIEQKEKGILGKIFG